jgi:mannose-6-phosphate isomerase
MISIESEEHPWGHFFVLHDELTYKLKRIEVDLGGLFYKYYYKRPEAWTIVDGIGITLDGKYKHYTKEHNVLVPYGYNPKLKIKEKKK